MIRHLRPKHLRTRLTFWYTAVLGVVLLFSWGIIASLFYWQAIQQMDRFAIQDVETVEGLLYFLPNGRLELRDDYHNHVESKQVLERLMEVRRLNGELLFSNERLGNRSLGGFDFSGCWSLLCDDDKAERSNPSGYDDCDVDRSCNRALQRNWNYIFWHPGFHNDTRDYGNR